MKTNEEGVIIITNDQDQMVGFIRKDPISRKNVVYSAEEMGLEEMQSVIKNDNKVL